MLNTLLHNALLPISVCDQDLCSRSGPGGCLSTEQLLGLETVSYIGVGLSILGLIITLISMLGIK